MVNLDAHRRGWGRSLLIGCALAGLGIGLEAGIGIEIGSEAEINALEVAWAQPGPPDSGPPAVDVAVAETGSLVEDLVETGRTQPSREVSLRARSEGQLVSLTVDVGDRVTADQGIGQIDDTILASFLNQAEAELLSRRSEVARSEAEVSRAQAQVEQQRLNLQQAEVDAARLQDLYEQGAVSRQETELAQTAAETTAQALRTAQEQVRTNQQVVEAAQARVGAQEEVIREAGERLSFASLEAPLSGVVLERLTEPGDLVQPGDLILRIGDFSQVVVQVQLSDLSLAQVSIGQGVEVNLDAFPDRTLAGQITQISPAADPSSGLVPIEITIPNPDARIGSGLLARVRIPQGAQDRIVVPESAVQSDAQAPRIFVVEEQGETAAVIARGVTVGEQAEGQVEILSGLQPGEAFVVRSSQPLQDGQQVRLSILSESGN